MSLDLPEDVHASTPGHPGFHEVIHEYLNRLSAGGVGGVFEVGHTGTLTLDTGEHHFTFEADATLWYARYNLGQAPTDGDDEFDIILHAAGGGSASIFDTPPVIEEDAGGGFVTGLFVPDIVEADAGDHITFNRTAIGAEPGSGLVTRLYWIYR